MITWWNQAACVNHDPEEFFPVGTGTTALQQQAAAKQICSTCPVREPCLTWAMETEADGVWGGLTEEERRSAAGPPASPGRRRRRTAYV